MTNKLVVLNKSPIVDFTCEIRFESSLPSDIVPGVLFSALNSLEVKNVQKLPVLEIPESARNLDPNLLYVPYYKAQMGDMTLQLGARMIGLSSSIPYVGWDLFKPKIEAIIEEILKPKIILQIKRVAIRVVNFFDIDILDNSNFSVKTPIKHKKQHYHYTDHYENGEVIIRTVIANNATQIISQTEKKVGSIIDIDSYIEKDTKTSLDLVMSSVDQAHEEGKNIFFDLLEEEFMKSLESKND